MDMDQQVDNFLQYDSQTNSFPYLTVMLLYRAGLH